MAFSIISCLIIIYVFSTCIFKHSTILQTIQITVRIEIIKKAQTPQHHILFFSIFLSHLFQQLTTSRHPIPTLSHPCYPIPTQICVCVYLLSSFIFSCFLLTHTQNACTEEEISRLIFEKVRRTGLLRLIP